MYKSVLIGCLWSFVSVANQTADDFKAFKNYTKSLKHQSQKAMDDFSPASVFEHYSENPLEGNYYQGVEQEKTDLSNLASSAINKEPGAQTVVDHFGQEKVEINALNPAIIQSKRIEEESFAITHGLSNDQIDCDNPTPVCERLSHEEHCFSAKQSPEQRCVKERKVLVESEKINQRADFSIVIAKGFTGTVTVNLITGVMSNVVSGTLTNPLRMSKPCEAMTAMVHAIQNNGAKANWVRLLSPPSCANNGLISFAVEKAWARKYPLQVALTVVANSKPYVAKEYIESQCTDFENKNNLCQVKNERCSDSSSPRVIDGLALSRECWAYEVSFTCSSAVADECAQQKAKGCFQTASTCVRYDNSSCALYEQTYRCEDKVCQAPVACIKDLFCADGDCVEQLKTENKDFGQSVSAFAVVGETGRELSLQPNVGLFKGEVVQCKILPLESLNCCHDKGWGQQMDLLHCAEEDKALGKAKLEYVAHYLGKFCSNEVAGECLEHKRSYCVFPSKMARIVQEARLQQLNPQGLGSAKKPTCKGLTLAELQQMDLGKIDFVTPIYPYGSGIKNPDAGIASDFKLKAQEPTKLTDEVARRLQKAAGAP